MADRSTSITLPQNKPNDDKIASPASVTTNTSDGEGVKVEFASTDVADEVNANTTQEVTTTKQDIKTDKAKTTVDDEGGIPTRNKDHSSSGDETKGEPIQDVTSNEGTPSPVKDAASIDAGNARPRRNFSRDEEQKAMRMINRCHAALDDASIATFEDKKNVIELTELVSQLTHILAASGMGKETTLRVIGYVRGPDKLDYQTAVLEAKRDRKIKRGRRASQGIRAPAKTNLGVDSKIQDKVNRAEVYNAAIGDVGGSSSDGKTDAFSTDIFTKADEYISAIRSQDGSATQKDEIATAKETSAVTTDDGQAAKKNEKPKKRFSRPKWNWRGKRRNENKKDEAENDDGKAAQDQEATGVVASSTKEPSITIDEQKDHSDLAPVQVARAA